jgi:hypothetical protein
VALGAALAETLTALATTRHCLSFLKRSFLKKLLLKSERNP